VTERTSTDVLIAGGGMAGAAAAAALGGLGLDVLVVEPGLDSTRRLAGELIHPPGTTDLAELGLLGALKAAGGVPVRGFAVFAGGDGHVLPYAAAPGQRAEGFAMEHATIAETIRGAIATLPRVTVWDGARVIGLDHAGGAAVRAVVAMAGHEQEVHARLLVGADGGGSTIRRLAGIGYTRRRISTMIGYTLHGVRLPHPGFGTVFLDGPAPALAYAVAPDVVRLMFDVPGHADGVETAVRGPGYLMALPTSVRDEWRRVMTAQRGLTSASYSIVPETVVRGRVALVGDAAGCCHPLTATGLSACTRDAVRLRNALRTRPDDIAAALRRYAISREGPQRTRLALAEALYALFVAGTPETRLLRHGLLRYWKSSARARAASMALLSTQENRISAMAREYALVVSYALPGLGRPRAPDRRPVTQARAAMQVSMAALRYAGAALWGLRA
jgi:2-polyprenyl-6-methoxyphenol hydroxylase-like FAD-dependent oxidoreductase